MEGSSLTRRGFLGTGLMLICAPAIVRATSIMPVRAWVDPYIDLASFNLVGGNRMMLAAGDNIFMSGRLATIIGIASRTDLTLDVDVRFLEGDCSRD